MTSWFSRRDFLPAGLKADQVGLYGNTIRIHTRPSHATAACPRCGTASRHSTAGIGTNQPICPPMGGRWN